LDGSHDYLQIGLSWQTGFAKTKQIGDIIARLASGASLTLQIFIRERERARRRLRAVSCFFTVRPCGYLAEVSRDILASSSSCHGEMALRVQLQTQAVQMFREPAPVKHKWKWPCHFLAVIIIGILVTISRMWLNPPPIGNLHLFGTLALIITAAGISLIINFLLGDD
jgi:hypothetical protein